MRGACCDVAQWLQQAQGGVRARDQPRGTAAVTARVPVHDPKIMRACACAAGPPLPHAQHTWREADDLAPAQVPVPALQVEISTVRLCMWRLAVQRARCD